jgi:hypothetical protein
LIPNYCTYIKCQFISEIIFNIISYLHVYPWALRLYHPSAPLYSLRCLPVGIEIVPPFSTTVQPEVSTRGHWDCTTLQHHCTAWGVYPWALRLYHPSAPLYSLRCLPVGIEIVPPFSTTVQPEVSSHGHWDCTILKQLCIAQVKICICM